MPHPHLPAIPRPPAVPPLWRESRIALEWAELRRSPVLRGAGVPPGHGRGVLLIPGFLAGDGTLGTMTQWLRAAGYRTKRAGIRANVSCSEVACARLEERLECLAERTGRRVVIIGQSRGGVLAKALGARRPDLVAGVVTLGAPVLSRPRWATSRCTRARTGSSTSARAWTRPRTPAWRCARRTAA